MNSIRSLVTGGAGFIGSHVARHCLEIGHEVVVLDDLSSGVREQVPADAVFVEGSVTDATRVTRLFHEHRFDYVYHLAAFTPGNLSHFARRHTYQHNVIGSANLINEAIRHDVRCLVFTSSIAVYGTGDGPMREDMAPRPEDPCAIAKYAVELDLRAAHEQFGLSSVIFRPHNVYGEHQNLGDRYRDVAGMFINQSLRGKPLTIVGDGTQTRAFSYVGDVAPRIARSVDVTDAYGQVINIGADAARSVNELAAAVGAAFGVQPAIEFLPAMQEAASAFASHDKARRLFGPAAYVELEEGIERTARWAERGGPRAGKRFEAIEVTRNLPPSWRA
ncbi:MAG TPA: NAD-dependent epimerase/dehydratase family protein [Gemmatimonadaceae bacterium]|nr:NAD-dependent epimerase/dehydratase family protein [Gemmatimonadaceae bacterium]